MVDNITISIYQKEDTLMLLAVDVGNTNIVIGCIREEEILFNERVSTNHKATDLEYLIQFKTILEIHGIDFADIEAAVMSSVVPDVTGVLKRTIKKLLGLDTLVVGPGVKTGLRIMIDNPAQLGADLVVDAAAGVSFYEPPLIIIDMGTATTFSVIDKDSSYLGGMIIPGMRTSLDALAAGAAQLSKVKLQRPAHVTGRNTEECMQSGIMYYTAAGIDGCIERIEAELGYRCTVIATGGLAGLIAPLCKRRIIYDNDLLLKGLMAIYKKNNGI